MTHTGGAVWECLTAQTTESVCVFLGCPACTSLIRFQHEHLVERTTKPLCPHTRQKPHPQSLKITRDMLRIGTRVVVDPELSAYRGSHERKV